MMSPMLTLCSGTTDHVVRSIHQRCLSEGRWFTPSQRISVAHTRILVARRGSAAVRVFGVTST